MSADPIDERPLIVLEVRPDGFIFIHEEFQPFLDNFAVVGAMRALAGALRLAHDLAGARMQNVKIDGSCIVPEGFVKLDRNEKVLQAPCVEYLDRVPTSSEHDWTSGQDRRPATNCLKCGVPFADYTKRAEDAFRRLSGGFT